MRLSSPDLWTLLWIEFQFNAMGCIQSIRCKPKSFRDSIIVLEVKTCIDSNPTSVDESSSVVLRYRTPHFRAHAHVLVPPVAGQETWTIGWIQACNHMEFFNIYGNKGMWVSWFVGEELQSARLALRYEFTATLSENSLNVLQFITVASNGLHQDRLATFLTLMKLCLHVTLRRTLSGKLP